MAFLNKEGLEQLWLHITSRLGKKVDKEEGKGLSSNDYTTVEKEQLATLNSLVGDTAVSEQINNAVANITTDSIGAVAEEDYYGLSEKEGKILTAKCLEPTSIRPTSLIMAAQNGTPDVANSVVAPITGWDNATLIRTGTNIIDTQNCVYCYNWGSSNPIILERTETGFKMTTNTDRENSWIRMMAYIGTREELAGQTITLTADYASSAEHANNRANKAIVLADTYGGYNASGTTSLGQVQGANSLTVTIPNEGTKYVYAMLYLGYGYTAPAGSFVEWSNVRVNIGDKDLGYEPYVAATLTADLPETVYGGTLDWNTGLLTVTHASYTVTGEEAWTWNGTSNNQRFETTIRDGEPPENYGGASYNVLCSHHIAAAGANRTGVWVANAGDGLRLRWKYSGGADGTYGGDVVAFTDYLKAQYAAGTPVVYVYVLETPTTYQLTSHQLEALKGQNVVWSNCGNTRAIFNYCISSSNGEVVLPEVLPIENGGTSATTAIGARENLLIIVSETEPANPVEGTLWFDIS